MRYFWSGQSWLGLIGSGTNNTTKDINLLLFYWVIAFGCLPALASETVCQRIYLLTGLASHGISWSGIPWEQCEIRGKMSCDDTTFHEFVMHYRRALTLDCFVLTHLIVWTVQCNIIYSPTAIKVIASANIDNVTTTHAKKSGRWYIEYYVSTMFVRTSMSLECIIDVS